MYKNLLNSLTFSALLLINSAYAANLTVLNHNFDFDAIPPSPGHTTHITGWVNTGFGEIGVWAPEANGNDYHNMGGRAQIAYLSEGGRISQTISTSLVNDETYTLSFDVGRNLHQTSYNFVARVKAKGHIIAQLQSDSFTIPQGDWTTQTLQFTATPDMPIGEPVVVEFHNLATSSSGQGVDIDNITFSTAGTGTDLPGDNLGPFTMVMEDTTLLVPDQYPNINVALRYLDDKQIKVGKTVTIQVTDCANQIYTESVNVAHPNGNAIHIIGDTDNPENCVLQFDGVSGFVAENNNEIGLISGFYIQGNNTNGQTGIFAKNNSVINVGPFTQVSNFTHGYFAVNNSLINARNSFAQSNLKFGYVANFNSTIDANFSNSNFNERGFQAGQNSNIQAEGSIAKENTLYGYEAYNGGTISAYKALAQNNNSHGFVAREQSRIRAAESVSRGNDRGYIASGMSYIDAEGAIAESNSRNFHPDKKKVGIDNAYIK